LITPSIPPPPWKKNLPCHSSGNQLEADGETHAVHANALIDLAAHQAVARKIGALGLVFGGELHRAYLGFRQRSAQFCGRLGVARRS
jgi:hypothetical protein